ncbi:MAG: hypothetical protein AAFP69_08260, partial [Planctomycetota bacterium]
PRSLQAYQQTRWSTLWFYSRITGLVTPYFQTSNRILQLGRNIALPIMQRTPYVGSQMVLAMAGLKTGWLTSTQPANTR